MTEVQTLSKAAIRICLDARAECLLVLRQAIEGAARAHGVDGRLLDDLKLAVTEAGSNVVKYAYPDSEGKLWVEFEADDDEIRIAVRDTGRWRESSGPVDPEQSGMGIPLIEAVADDTQIESDGAGTRVTMVFERRNRATVEAENRDD